MTTHAAADSHGEDPVAARSNMLLAVRLFILSELMLFGALFAAYFVIRSESGGWPPAGQARLDLLLPAINTLVLLSSSFTMQWARRAIGRGQVATMRLGLRLTLVLGLVFIVIQGYEFATNGFGLSAGTFGSTFYTVSGFHVAHVLAGLGFMAILATRARRGLISQEHHTAVVAGTWYWHLVVVVAVFLFSALYVL